MMINSYLFYEMGEQLKVIETQQEEKEYEKIHVCKMMYFFSLQWMLAGIMNMINAFYPRHTNNFARDLYDFLLGAMLGV